MRPFIRIAGILLGAAAFGLVVLASWTTVQTEYADIKDRLRRARCVWVDPLVVTVAGHELSLAANVHTTVHGSIGWIHGEDVSGYRAAGARFGFCLPALPEAPLVARSVTVALGPAGALAGRAGLPAVDGGLLVIAEPALFLPDAPPAAGQSTTLEVYGRNPDYGWPRMVTEGVGADGLRIGAVCRDGIGTRWLCDVSALDASTGLSYGFARLPVDIEAFDGQPLPAPFHDVSVGMRRLAGMLEADARAGR